MKTEDRIDHIVNWLNNYFDMSKNIQSLIVGVSGGIDSAVTSTLCAKSGLKTIVVSMPIRQNKNQHDLSLRHITWLKENYKNVESFIINLDNLFKSFQEITKKFNSELAYANSRSRLRMATLYQIAQFHNGLVVGTGNKVEDFGIGFYTKYGDGGVDISPIADCTKSQVWSMGSILSIIEDIVNASPTDGLWDDSRNDVSQIGLTYQQIEEAMTKPNSKYYSQYLKIREPNLHKMKSIPVCKFNEENN